MANVGEGKCYGLITSKKAQLSVPRPGNIFDNDSNSDSDNGTDWVKKSMKSSDKKGTVKKQTQLDMQRALKEDPTIYEYDEVYDEMERKKNDANEKKKEIKKSRYVENMLRTMERRKIEQEHRAERKVQKEREAEGEEFADKESFITSAYKAKQEEFRKLEEEEKRMERLEAMADVAKIGNMTAFHRHLYEQTFEKKLEPLESENMQEKVVEGVMHADDLDHDDNISSESESAVESDSDEDQKFEEVTSRRIKLKRIKGFQKKKQYRKKVSDSESEVSSDDEEEKDDCLINETDEPMNKRSRIDEIKSNYAELEKETNERLKAAEENLDNIIKKVAGKAKDGEVEGKLVVVEKKRSIWEKRCHGDLFEEAVRRYYERKAERLANNVVY